MEIKNVYQTLENRNTDINLLESKGPYPCTWENSWLGDGYYFWDHFIENAHWWGKEVRAFNNGYIICKAICDFDQSDCLDLVGNPIHLEKLYDAFLLMQSNGFVDDSTTTKRVIDYLQNDLKVMRFSAVRVLGLNSKDYYSHFNYTLLFESDKAAYLDFKPPYQICFFDKKSLNLRSYKVFHSKPNHSHHYI